MCDDSLSFLDCLPIRPSPQPLESLCSYLARTGHANGLNRLESWRNILGLKTYMSAHARDNPPLDFGEMPRLLDCSTEHLLGMTFHYLTDKFLCSWKQGIKLVAGSVASHLRYCPVCLLEHSYYKLTWRFTCIPGCLEHGCYLHDCCPHCQMPLRLLPLHLDVNTCPECGGHLADSHAEPLTPQDKLTTEVRTTDLVFLLQPHAITYRLPHKEKLVRLRQVLGIPREEVARFFSWGKANMFNFERNPSPSILDYHMHYADCLGLSLREVLAYREHHLSLPDDEVHSIRSLCVVIRQQKLAEIDLYEEGLLNRVKQAVVMLRSQGTVAKQVTISGFTKIPPDEMIIYPRVKEYLEQVARERIQQRQQARQAYCAQIHAEIVQAIVQLDAVGKPPSAKHISQIVGVNVYKLTGYDADLDYLIASAIDRASHYIQIRDHETGVISYQHEDEVAERIQQLLCQAEQNDVFLLRKDIAHLVGARLGTLRVKPHILRLLDDHQQKQIQHRQAEILTKIEVAFHTLQVNNRRVTIAMLGRSVGMAWSELKRYPILFERVVELVEQYKLEREANLLAMVMEAEQKFRATGQPITLKLLGEMVGMVPMNLKRYPSIFAFLSSLPEFPELKKPPR